MKSAWSKIDEHTSMMRVPQGYIYLHVTTRPSFDPNTNMAIDEVIGESMVFVPFKGK